jgi:hypothetical protein
MTISYRGPGYQAIVTVTRIARQTTVVMAITTGLESSSMDSNRGFSAVDKLECLCATNLNAGACGSALPVSTNARARVWTLDQDWMSVCRFTWRRPESSVKGKYWSW